MLEKECNYTENKGRGEIRREVGKISKIGADAVYLSIYTIYIYSVYYRCYYKHLNFTLISEQKHAIYMLSSAFL